MKSLDDPDGEGGDFVGIVRIGHALVIEAEVIVARQVGSVDTILALHLLSALATELLDERALKDLVQLGAIAVDEEVSFADDILTLAVEGIVPRSGQTMGSSSRVGVHVLLHRDDVVVVIGDVVEEGHLALHILQLLSGEAEGVSSEEVFATHLAQIALCGFLRAHASHKSHRRTHR